MTEEENLFIFNDDQNDNNPLNEKIRENYKKVQEQINNIEVNIHELLSKQEKNFLKS